jgi:hypothetical protein
MHVCNEAGDEISIHGNTVEPNQHLKPLDTEPGASGFRFNAKKMTRGPLARAPWCMCWDLP